MQYNLFVAEYVQHMMTSPATLRTKRVPAGNLIEYMQSMFLYTTIQCTYLFITFTVHSETIV